MGVRDQEITRIEKYSAGLGIKVIWVRSKRGDNTGASWSTDGSEITMYIWPGKTKTQIILDFVHELAHHMAWLADKRKTTNRVNDAFDACDDSSDNEPAAKDKRKIVYLTEKADAQYRDKVWDELGIKVPRWKMEADRKLDVWCYKYYWRTGKDPIRKLVRKKRKEFRKLFKP